MGQDTVLGFEDDYSVAIWFSSQPPRARRVGGDRTSAARSARAGTRTSSRSTLAERSGARLSFSAGIRKRRGGEPAHARARQDPQRRRRRPPRDGKDVARRGAPLPDGQDQPARHRRGRHDRLGRRRGRAQAAALDLDVARAHRVAGPQGQPRRRPRRSGVPGRAALRGPRRRGRARDGLGGDGRRGGHERAPGGSPTSSASRAWSS